jgi:hypothetical protein
MKIALNLFSATLALFSATYAFAGITPPTPTPSPTTTAVPTPSQLLRCHFGNKHDHCTVDVVGCGGLKGLIDDDDATCKAPYVVKCNGRRVYKDDAFFTVQKLPGNELSFWNIIVSGKRGTNPVFPTIFADFFIEKNQTRPDGPGRIYFSERDHLRGRCELFLASGLE